jgi:hypothetical protein
MVSNTTADIRENTLTFCREDHAGKQVLAGCFSKNNVLNLTMFDNVRLNQSRNFIGLTAVLRVYNNDVAGSLL